MSIQTKEKLKRLGTIALGTMALSGLMAVVGVILYVLNNRIDTTQAKVSEQASTLNSIKVDTCWIKGRLNGEKFPSCPIPTN